MAAEIITGIPTSVVNGDIVVVQTVGPEWRVRIGCEQKFEDCQFRGDPEKGHGPSCQAINIDSSGGVIYGQVYCGKDSRVTPSLNSVSSKKPQ